MDRSAPPEDEQADLLSMLELIEDQPLAERAAAYEGLRDRLARRLEATPAIPSTSS